MTVETMAGTAAYLREHGYDTEAVKVRVATPGGTTERGLIQPRGARPARRLPRGGRRGGGGDALMDLWLAVTREDVARLRQHAGAGLPGADLHPDHPQLDPADPLQPLAGRGS